MRKPKHGTSQATDQGIGEASGPSRARNFLSGCFISNGALNVGQVVNLLSHIYLLVSCWQFFNIIILHFRLWLKDSFLLKYLFLCSYLSLRQ